MNILLKIIGLLACASFAAFGSGCAAVPCEAGKMTAGVGTLQNPHLVKEKISVEDVSGGSETDPLGMSMVGTDEFREALVQSLKQSDTYSKTQGRFALSAQIVRDDTDETFTVVTEDVHYELSDKVSQKILFNESVSASVSYGISDVFFSRLRIAKGKAIKANIEKLFSLLSELNFEESADGN